MGSNARFIFLLIAIAIQGKASPVTRNSILWEGRVGPFYSRVTVWTVPEFTEPNLRAFYQRLAQKLKGNRAWKVEVFVDRNDAYRELYGKLVTEGDYDWWLKLYNKFGRKLLPKAEILSYRSNAVLRLRDRAGTCSEVVLSGDNFLRVHADNIEFEILEVYYHPLPPQSKPRHGDEAMVSLYVRASSFPKADQARAFALLMRKRFQQKQIIATIRTDSYFLTDNAFPIMYRFDATAAPPSPEQYKQSKIMYCFCDEPAIRCQ